MFSSMIFLKTRLDSLLKPIVGKLKPSYPVETRQRIRLNDITREGIVDEMELKGTISGWAKVLSNLKSFLETNHTLPGLW